jgi:hypothetical protein
MTTGTEAILANIAENVAQQGQGSAATQVPSGGASAFDNILESYQGTFDNVKAELMQSLGAGERIHPADNAVSAENLQITATDLDAVQPVQADNVAANMLTDLNKSNLRMDQIMNVATSGQKFSNQELLLLQGAMHQLTFEAEVVVKVADAAKSGIRQVSSTQV